MNTTFEKKVYNGYAFKVGEWEKGAINREIYAELARDDKFVVCYCEPLELSHKRALLLYLNSGYASSKFKVLSNPDNLSDDELALICDQGNLCFGYHKEGDIITIYTD